MAEKPKRTITRRMHHSPEQWAQARRDYLSGYTASAVSARYGMSVDAIRKRASLQGWCKSHHVADQEIPPPLHPFPDEAQAVKIGDSQFASLWNDIAHDAQRAPPSLPGGGEWSTWLFQGGRGAGKTRAGAEWLAQRAEAKRGLYAMIGPTQHDVREVMVDGPSGLRNLPGRAMPDYERSRRRLVWPNGSIAYAFSAEEPERLRGPQFEAAWADEF
ncbi:MAG: terminase family protein, partial [Terricaulis sp.]